MWYKEKLSSSTRVNTKFGLCCLNGVVIEYSESKLILFGVFYYRKQLDLPCFPTPLQLKFQTTL